MKILLLELGRIGDTIITLPATKALKKAFPDSEIIRICTPIVEPILRRCPYLDEIIIYHREKKKPKWIWQGIKLLIKIRKICPEIFINFHTPDVFRSSKIYFRDNLFSFLTGAKSRVAYFSDSTGIFLTHGIKAQKEHQRKYVLDLVNDLVQQIGCIPDKELELWLDDQDRQEAEKFLKDHLIREDIPIAIVHPGATRPSRRWPIERFIKITKWLSKDLTVIITGNETETFLAEQIQNVVTKVIVASGKLSLMGTAALLERAALLLTNDTGIMHFAFALKTPTVALFGPELPERWVQMDKNWIKVIRHPMPCSPCYKWNCSDLRCLKAISVEEVKDAISLLLKEIL